MGNGMELSLLTKHTLLRVDQHHIDIPVNDAWDRITFSHNR